MTIVEKILHAWDIYPSCNQCPNGVGFADHVPAEKHWRAVCEKLPDNKPIVPRHMQYDDVPVKHD